MTKFDMKIYKELGKLLKEARLSKNMSLDTLSSLLDGRKTKSTLKRYEDGNSRIDMETLSLLCGILGLDYDYSIKKAYSMSDASSQWGDDRSTVTQEDLIEKINELEKEGYKPFNITPLVRATFISFFNIFLEYKIKKSGNGYLIFKNNVNKKYITNVELDEIINTCLQIINDGVKKMIQDINNSNKIRSFLSNPSSNEYKIIKSLSTLPEDKILIISNLIESWKK